MNQPKPQASATPKRADDEEIEQRKKMEERARRFAGPSPAVAQTATKQGTKRPSDQGLEGEGQLPAKQMRLLASRKVVAKAKVVQQRQNQNLLQQRQQQQKTLAPPTAVWMPAQQSGATQRIPASQRLGTKSAQQQQQPVSASHQTTAASVPRPIRSKLDVSIKSCDLP